MALLEVKNISKGFDGKKIIENIHLTLNKGEIVSLLGVSGVGKTTLFNVIAGILPADTGEILLNDEPIGKVTGKVSYMLQKDLLLPHLTILDNVALPMFIQGMKKSKARQKALSLFADFGLVGTERQYPSQLSGGMRQRAAFLRTYLFSNEVALLDEPFSALDAITKDELHRWYMEVMRQIQLSTILITHDVDEAVMLSDRICIMTGSPGTITEEIVVARDKYDRTDFNLTEEFLRYKKSIIDALGNEK